MANDIIHSRGRQLAQPVTASAPLVRAVKDITIAFQSSMPKEGEDKARLMQLYAKATEGFGEDIAVAVLEAFVFEPGRRFAPTPGEIREACHKAQHEKAIADCGGVSAWTWARALSEWRVGFLAFGRNIRWDCLDPLDPAFVLPARVEQAYPEEVAQFRVQQAEARKQREHERRYHADPEYRAQWDKEHRRSMEELRARWSLPAPEDKRCGEAPALDETPEAFERKKAEMLAECRAAGMPV